LTNFIDGRSDWRGHVVRASEKINAHMVLMRTPEETDCSADLCVKRILLKWLMNKQYGKALTT